MAQPARKSSTPKLHRLSKYKLPPEKVVLVPTIELLPPPHHHPLLFIDIMDNLLLKNIIYHSFGNIINNSISCFDSIKSGLGSVLH